MTSCSRLILALSVVLCMHAVLGGSAWAEGEWSKNAVPLPAGRPFRVPSPDRKKTAFVEGTRLSVIDGGQACSGLEGYSLLGHAELVWSPDSSAFTVTESEGGQDGPWFVTIFAVKDGVVTLSEPFDAVMAKMHERYACLGQTDPNIGAVWWLKESSQLLIAARVPAAAACARPGEFRGYLVDVATGKILYEFDQAGMKENFADHLGDLPTRPLFP